VSARLAVDGPVARLTLERPHVLNALDRSVAAALEAAQRELARADGVTAVIVSGQGRAFCAGNDIAEMPALTAADARELSARWQAIVDGFAALPQVTIAAVRGVALGGGLMLAVAQDLRVAETSARLGLPEVSLGFNPSYGIARLLDVAGGAHGRDLLFTARTVDAAEALGMGLVNRVVVDGALESAVAELAHSVARHPRGGLAASKAAVAAIRAGRPGGEAEAYAALLHGDPAARARIAAFVAGERRR
jgi:enoyl-CoA hydratase